MTFEQIVQSLDQPVSVLAGLTGILGASAAALIWLWPKIPQLKTWWASRFDRRRNKALQLLSSARDFPTQMSDRDRLRRLQCAAFWYSWGKDAHGRAAVTLRIAEARSAILSSVRNDKRARVVALRAAAMAEACGEYRLAAESVRLAGDLSYVPLALRDENAAKELFARARRLYRQAGDDTNADETQHRLDSLRRVYGPNNGSKPAVAAKSGQINRRGFLVGDADSEK